MIDKVAILLDAVDVEEAFEMLDITPYEVITILLREGLVVLPPFLEDIEDGFREEQEESTETQA